MYKRTEFGHNAENKHQRNQELKALDVFQSIRKKYPVKKCGIFIDPELCFIGASPFSLYGDNCLLCIKCPLKQFNKPMAEAMAKLPLWKKVRGEFEINQKSAWYIQVQGQLHITQLKKAFLMVWFGKEHKILKISKDDEFFNREMKEKLSFFLTL